MPKENIGLLLLPVEIRQAIYEPCFSVYVRSLSFRRENVNIFLEREDAGYINLCPQLFRTCKQIHYESAPFLYSKLEFSFHDPIVLFNFLHYIGPTNTALLHKMSFWPPHFESVGPITERYRFGNLVGGDKAIDSQCCSHMWSLALNKLADKTLGMEKLEFILHSFGALDDKLTCERMASKFLNENAGLDHAEMEERRYLFCGHRGAEDDMIRAMGRFVGQGTIAIIGPNENSWPLKLQKHFSGNTWVRTNLESRFGEAILWTLSPEGDTCVADEIKAFLTASI
ncbi:hypothetical protein BGZ60DRAFT_51184 [Tricladium varicosporioides]|nr:hypothetical protein BGZ60DRAFT_51184 [Hymenoscyphus varicosporioides]